MCAEKITNLAKAMLEVQKVVRPVCKDKLNSFTQSRHATLNSVMEACSEDDDTNTACNGTILNYQNHTDFDLTNPRIATLKPRSN
jgi:ERF superfamily